MQVKCPDFKSNGRNVRQSNNWDFKVLIKKLIKGYLVTIYLNYCHHL